MKQKPLNILNDLLSIDSQVCKSNKEIVSYIKNYYPDSEISEYTVNGIKMNNLLVKINGKSKKPLVFAAHTDTVNIQEGWETNPLSPFMKDGKIFGLGASDMKGSLACIIASSLFCNPYNDVYLLFFGSEEDNSQGARKIIERGFSLNNAKTIVPEPTNRRIYLKQRGYLYCKVDEEFIEKRFTPHECNFEEEKSKLLKRGAEVIYSNPPYYLSEDSSLVKIVKSIVPELKISKKPVHGWTEAGIFNRFGEAIIMGPGDYEQCHKPNEFIQIEELDYFTKIFSKIINYKN